MSRESRDRPDTPPRSWLRAQAPCVDDLKPPPRRRLRPQTAVKLLLLRPPASAFDSASDAGDRSASCQAPWFLPLCFYVLLSLCGFFLAYILGSSEMLDTVCGAHVNVDAKTKKKKKFEELKRLIKKLHYEKKDLAKRSEVVAKVRLLAKEDLEVQRTLAMLGAIPSLVVMLNNSSVSEALVANFLGLSALNSNKHMTGQLLEEKEEGGASCGREKGEKKEGKRWRWRTNW
ncbi:chaperone protein ClpB [Spatholobus suberectus]|nr:chaperone protein ClpB [Spatholobus suberectus]